MMEGGYSKPQVTFEDWIDDLEKLTNCRMQAITFSYLKSTQLMQVQVEG